MITAPEDTLSRQLARAVSERSAHRRIAIGAPLLQRTPATAAQALKEAGTKSVSNATLNKWLNQRASADERTKNSEKHNVSSTDLADINERLEALWNAERAKDKKSEATVDYTAGWTTEPSTRLGTKSGKKTITYTPLAGGQKANGRVDLLRLVAEAAGGNIHSANVGSVVGGTAVTKAAKQVDGLNDANARIDRQNPPPGAFNLQYQIGDGSHAGVIFAQDDPARVVLQKLIESFDSGLIVRSPRAARV